MQSSSSFDFHSLLFRQACQRIFSPATIRKGEVHNRYPGVGSIKMGAGDDIIFLSATVYGNAQPVYEVQIDIVCPPRREINIYANCSCPVELNCKHAYAVLVEVMSHSQTTLVPPRSHLPQTTLVPHLNDPMQRWLDIFNPSNLPVLSEEDYSGSEKQRLLYIVDLWTSTEAFIQLVSTRLLKKGGYGVAQKVSINFLSHVPMFSKFFLPQDKRLVKKLWSDQTDAMAGEHYLLTGRDAVEIFQEILATGRCHWNGKDTPPLSLGPSRFTTPIWHIDKKGVQYPAFSVETASMVVLPLPSPWYLDTLTHTCGPLETTLPAPVASKWLSCPPILPEASVETTPLLATRLPTLSLPVPQPIVVQNLKQVTPTPVLWCFSLAPSAYKRTFDTSSLHVLQLQFDYAGFRLLPSEMGEDKISFYRDGTVTQIQRNKEVELRCRQTLIKQGVIPVRIGSYWETDIAKMNDFSLPEAPDHATWLTFMAQNIPLLRAAGWKIEEDESFELRTVTVDDWYTDMQPDEKGDWFDLELGVHVNGEQINLLPVLTRMIQHTDKASLQALQKVPPDQQVHVRLLDGRRVLMSAERLQTMLNVLVELYDPTSINAAGKLKLNRLRASELASLDAGGSEWRWLGGKELRELYQRLHSFSGMVHVPPSLRLKATLRGYQQEGLNWLQFLRQYDLAGVLADDMGLGKTVQVLAHLLIEKENGRMDRPSLVVAPTSLMSNWQQEVERFAPDLTVLVQHGLDRKQHFEKLAQYDLIVTSYPLLPRDEEILLAQEFYLIVLDEAQYIKNPKTRYSQIVCQLKGRHRLCLTGTPIQNNLDDLWSLFHFLLPGYLGDSRRFRTLFRTPIEKGGDQDRLRVLVRKTAPFMLRRRKDEVIKELPPKTNILQKVDLAGGQRDLYESIRLAMHRKVQEAISQKGMARSQIVILDALLKLRQVCCDPRLLKIEAARKVKESVKLELLMDLLPEMISEGKRILLFSQFTSMLALIEPEIKNRGLSYLKLTGETTKRGPLVARFQNGEAPLFLISLRAGGTGLNLTAADTIIHYDPWWNPAVENQATDRAHRIGQNKAIFVYKFIASGTVEEKIVVLQDRKRGLSEGVLNADGSNAATGLHLTHDDLDFLFAPLGG